MFYNYVYMRTIKRLEPDHVARAGILGSHYCFGDAKQPCLAASGGAT